MKPQFKRVWRWIAASSVLALLVLCVIWWLYPQHHRLRVLFHSHTLATKIKPKKAGSAPSSSTNQSLTPALSRPTREGEDNGWESFKEPGSFVMALARDGAGNVWVGTEGNGVWRFNPHASVTNQWTQFTTTNGLGDDYAYSLAVDKQGRIWAGHLNHGVSVFNGTTWKNYDIPNGPIGERIFKIAVCPADGDVWMGTSAGLTRYSVSKNTWIHYTKGESGNQLTPAISPAGGSGEGESLPSDQISAIAFDAKGNIYVGTQCDGLAVASRESDYMDWKSVPVADQKVPTFAGFGLPSKLINDLLVASDGTIYAATDGGLAWTRDGGENWQFRRGRDFPDKMKGLAGGPPKGWSARNIPKDLLPEDYVSCLAEDDAGVVWADFRQHGLLGLEGFGYYALANLTPQETGGADYGRAILSMPDYRPWLASYGRGLLRAVEPRRLSHLTAHKDYSDATNPPGDAPFPTPARVPELAELNSLLKEIEAVPTARLTNGAVLSLEDDWRTEGQWQGRYGRFWIALCANWSPHDDVWGAGWDVAYSARLGLNHAPGDSLRYWVQWLATNDNRCLEMSPPYLHSRVLKNLTTWDMDRRESEWDDHGEAYPMSKEGPDVYCSLRIPAGLFYLSLYEVDKDGQEGHSNNNRFRDYTVSIRPHAGQKSLDEHYGNITVIRSFYDIAEFDQRPELAYVRVHDFWGGAYKRFLVRGPTMLTIQINRNHSFNTILPGVMLDLVDELPPPYFQTRQEWEQKQKTDGETNVDANLQPAATETEAAQRLASALNGMPFKNETWWAENKRRFYLPLLRWQQAETNETNSPALATSFYQLNLFSDWERQLRQENMATARGIEKALRWDGVTPSNAGRGYQMITDYVATHPARLNQTASIK